VRVGQADRRPLNAGNEVWTFDHAAGSLSVAECQVSGAGDITICGAVQAEGV